MRRRTRSPGPRPPRPRPSPARPGPAPLETVSTTSYRLSTANADTAAAALRDLVAALLRTTGHEALAESARLCTSEVVMNVYRHTCSRLIYVEVTIDAHRVTVYVHDDQPRDLPIPLR
ncbi:ATP-binding protein [Streptomyces mirabilis]|uniref:ATP-binding protein n=1 Tax=Streptomyces mirabilis TaxID=68239 RepID=UPI003F4B1F22